MFDDEATVEEEALLKRLRTSTPAGQAELVQKMAAGCEPQCRPVAALTPSATSLPTFWRPAMFRRPLVLWAGLGACAAALGAAGYVVLRPVSDRTLLARAYDRERPSELRVPGETFGPLYSPTRAAGGDERPSRELLELKMRAEEAFERTPNDSRVRQLQGRIAVTEHRGESARRSFEIAEALNPTLPGLKFDLATAYFELGESGASGGGAGMEYARAIDLFSQYLHDTGGKDAVALYDRGLCWEREGVSSAALQDYQAALALEPAAAWRHEIEQRLERLKAAGGHAEATPGAGSSDLSGATSHTVEAPAKLLAAFLAVPESAEGFDAPGRYEFFLDLAGREWLPTRAELGKATALQLLARLGERHRDEWLTDFLAAPASSEGDRALADALTATAQGSPDASLAASARAMDLYAKAHNRPGYLRAAADHLYSEQRTGHAQASLTDVLGLQRDPALSRYSYLQTFLALQVGSSRSMLGSSAGWAGIREAAEQAKRDGLTTLALRGASFVVNGDVQQGRYDVAWSAAVEGLNQSAGLAQGGMGRYQMLYALQTMAATLDLGWTRAGLLEAGAAEAGRTTNRIVQAYAYEEVGVQLLQMGDVTGAAHSMRTADELMGGLAGTQSGKVYQADWLTDRARLLARQKTPAQGLTLLQAGEGSMAGSEVFSVKLAHEIERGDLLRRLNRTSDALAIAWQTVQACEGRLAEVATRSDRAAWQASSAKAYEELVLDLVQAGEDEAALRAWEWYRSAPDRTVRSPESTMPATWAELPKLPAAAPGELTLVYARAVDRYLAWSVADDAHGGVRLRPLGVNKETVLRNGASLLRLCSDRNASAQDVSLLSTTLGTQLLTPFAPQLERANLVRIDLDPTLAELPFATLTVGGRPLGLEHGLVFLSGRWYLQPPREANTDRLPENARLVVVREPARPGSRLIPGSYDESSDLARRFPLARLEEASFAREEDGLSLGNGRAELRGELAEANIVHYTGHEPVQAAERRDAGTGARRIDLGPGSLPQCRLAVLAACRSMHGTGAWSGTGVSGDTGSFARLMRAGGARYVLATQWDVDSAMTCKLMLRFYAELARQQTFSEALRRAEVSLQADAGSSHPYFWSAFQLAGD